MIDEGGQVLADLPELDDSRLRDLYEEMVRVRCVDRRMLKLQRAGRIGFVGSMLGMEAAMIGTAAALRQTDWLWSGLREGGAALMRGLPLSEYIAQMYGNGNDTAKGRQMCNHFQHRESNYPSWSSVIGTQIAHGTGAAYATRVRGESDVHGIYFGDGATSSNSFHSGLGFGAVWKVPAVYVCMDNGWAISVPASEQTGAESYAAKAEAYGMPGLEVDGNDVLACFGAMHGLVERARAGEGPALLVVCTYRMLGHSSSDDPSQYRSQDEVDDWANKDPIDRYGRFLEQRGLLAPGEDEAVEAESYAVIDEEIHLQETVDPMPLKSMVEDTYAEVPRHLQKQYNDFIKVAERLGDAQPGDGAFPL